MEGAAWNWLVEAGRKTCAELTIPAPIVGSLNGLQGGADHKHRELQCVDAIEPNDLKCFALARNRDLVFTYEMVVLLRRSTKSDDYLFTLACELTVQYSTGYRLLDHFSPSLLGRGQRAFPTRRLRLIAGGWSHAQTQFTIQILGPGLKPHLNGDRYHGAEARASAGPRSSEAGGW